MGAYSSVRYDDARLQAATNEHRNGLAKFLLISQPPFVQSRVTLLVAAFTRLRLSL